MLLRINLFEAMKRYLLLFVFCLVAVIAMPQPRPNQRDTHRPPMENPHGQRGHHHGPSYYCATPDQMALVMKTIKKQSFDEGKLEIANLCVTLGQFCTEDLAVMAGLFSFDDHRLAFLKYAYTYCTDPQNYFRLRDSFTFRSNYDALMEYIQRL